MATPAYLVPQSVTVPFRAGVDTKTSDKAVNPPSLLAATNVSFDAPGEIKKDRPYQVTAALPNSVDGVAVPTPIYRAFSVGARRALVAKNDLYDVLDTGKTTLVKNFLDGVGKVIGGGLVASTSADPLFEFPADRSAIIWDVDYAYANGYEVVCRSDFVSSLSYVVRDRETNAVIYAGVISTMLAGGQARAIAVSNRWLVIVWPDTSLACKYIAVDTTSLPTSLASATVSAADIGANHCIDVAADSADNSFWCAYHSTAGGNAIRVAKLFLLGGNTSAIVAGASPTGGSIGLGVSSDGLRAMVAWCNTAGGLNVAGFSATVPGGGPTFLATTVENAAATVVKRIGVCDAADGTAMYVVYENATAAPTVVTRVRVVVSTAIAGTRRTVLDYQLAHKPFVRNSVLFFGVGYTEGFLATNTQNYYCTVASDPTFFTVANPIAWYLCGPACVRQNANMLANVVLDTTAAEYRWMGTERANVSKQNAAGWDFSAQLSLQSLRFNDGNPIALGDTFAVPGNAVRDSGGYSDIAFQFAPTISTIVYSGGGSLVVGQTYEWVAIYESVDSDGNVHRSLPSLPVSGTATNTRASVTISDPFTRYGNNISIVLYRTLAGLGAPHYRSQEQFLGTGNGRSGFASHTLIDTAPDATIATYQQLYTDQGILPNYPPPMGRHWCIHQNRIWSIDEHSGDLRYTRTLVSGEGPCWNPILAVPLVTDRVVAKGLVSSPNGLWVVGQDAVTGAGAIALVLGDGPADNGTGATYTVQRLEGNNAGISTANAFVSTPVGIFFEDPKLGIHLLPSGGGIPQAIGLPIESLRTGKTLVRATLLQDRHEVRFVYTTGFMLVYDYVVNQWFSRQLVGTTYALVDSCVWDGVHVVTDSVQGPLAQVSTGKDLLSGASGTYFPSTLTTGWIHLADFEGLQRIWGLYLIGTAYDFMGMTVTISYDFDDSVSDTHTFLDTDLPSTGPLELRIPLRKQTGTSFKVSVADSASASGTTHRGYGLVALRIEYGVFSRSNRVKPARTKG